MQSVSTAVKSLTEAGLAGLAAPSDHLTDLENLVRSIDLRNHTEKGHTTNDCLEPFVLFF